MKFKTTKNLMYTPENVLRTCGYFPIFNRKNQKFSFVKKLSNNRYPRFHLYLKEIENELIFDLHLDQSQTVYVQQKAHNADYDSLEVKQELVRIFQEVKKNIRPDPEEKTDPIDSPSPKTYSQPNWLSKLFKKN